MRVLAAVAAALLTGGFATSIEAKLPPPSDEAKAKAAETAPKAAWTDKVGLYHLCLAMDRSAGFYRTSAKESGQEVSAPVATPPCTDPGPFAATTATPASPGGSKTSSSQTAGPRK